MRFVIIGGGINGYCCAVQILEHFKNSNSAIEVTIISEAFTPNTTGDGSAGLWGPFILGNTSEAKVHRWSKGMHNFLEKIWLTEDAGEAGVCLIPCVRLNTNVDPFWSDIVYGCQQLTEEQLNEFNRNRAKKYTSGLHFVTYTSEPAKLLPYLMKRYQSLGGKVIQQKVTNLQQYIADTDFDAYINCTGLGSRQIVNDEQMYPVRGQVSRVRANWIYCALLDDSDDGNYIIPNCESVVLGGTHQEGDYQRKVYSEDKDFIIKGCQKIVPGLVHVQHLYDWVGLRPGRNEVRLEAEQGGKKIVIHNYGHGGSGVTLAWGCAEDVMELLEYELNKRNSFKSKL